MLPGIDLAGVTGLVPGERARDAAAAAGRPDRRGPLQPDLRVDDAAGSLRVLRRPALHGVLLGPRHGPRAPGDRRPGRDPGAGPGHLRPLPGPGRHRRPVLCDGHVDGIVPRDEATVAAGLDGPARAAAASSLVDALVALHQVDPDQVGLGELGRHGYLERQLARWQGQLDQTRTRPLPALDEVHRRLAASLPAQVGPARIVGDAASTTSSSPPPARSWPCSTGRVVHPRRPWPTSACSGVLGRARRPDPRARHRRSCPASRAGPPSPRRTPPAPAATCPGLDTYVAFASWKLAVILEGVVARHTTGLRRGDDTWRGFAEVVVELADRALELTDRLLTALADGAAAAGPAAAGLTIAWSWRSRNQGRRVIGAGGRWP